MVTLPKDVDLAAAEEAFSSAEASSALAREARDTPERPSFGIVELLSAIRTARPLSSVADGTVLPLRALRLYRRLLEREAIGYSQMARAARTGEDVRRKVGPFEVDLVVDDDAVFLTISPIGTDIPSAITLINDTQETVVMALPEPVNAVVQLGLASASDDAKTLIRLMEDVTTSIFIT